MLKRKVVSLAFLGGSSAGNPTGTGIVHYTDGSEQSFKLAVNDFWSPPGPSNEIMATVPYLNVPTGKYTHTSYIFYTSVAIDPNKQVSAVTLPTISSSPAGHQTAMHLFAVSVH